ncbi:hypothetical protein [Mesorhizobium sp.]|uniref:hypothetical protein n=1 Tax=Mesorhizobium sp. TaxID=1871066 RepID=UPI0025CCA443|nr:hypothetical protein [Mesorhizobium sp.]
MSVTKEFFETWLEENVGDLPAESGMSIAVLALQFEQDAEAAGYGHAVREDEIGNIEEATEKALKRARTGEEAQVAAPAEESDLAPVMEEAAGTNSNVASDRLYTRRARSQLRGGVSSMTPASAA